MSISLKGARAANGISEVGSFNELIKICKNTSHFDNLENHSKLSKWENYSYSIIGNDISNMNAAGDEKELSARYTSPTIEAGVPDCKFEEIGDGAAELLPDGKTVSYGNNKSDEERISKFIAIAEGKTSEEFFVKQNKGEKTTEITGEYIIPNTSIGYNGGLLNYQVIKNTTSYWNNIKDDVENSSTDVTTEDNEYYVMVNNNSSMLKVSSSEGIIRVYGNPLNEDRSETITFKLVNSADSCVGKNIIQGKNESTFEIIYINKIKLENFANTDLSISIAPDSCIYPIIYFGELNDEITHDNANPPYLLPHGSFSLKQSEINNTTSIIGVSNSSDGLYNTDMTNEYTKIRPAYHSTENGNYDLQNNKSITIVNLPIKCNWSDGKNVNIDELGIPIAIGVEILRYKDGRQDGSFITDESSYVTRGLYCEEISDKTLYGYKEFLKDNNDKFDQLTLISTDMIGNYIVEIPITRSGADSNNNACIMPSDSSIKCIIKIIIGDSSIGDTSSGDTSTGDSTLGY